MCSNSNRRHEDHDHPPSILIFDGGTGREIEAQGGPFRQPEWSALSLYEAPQLVQQVHESFLHAGAIGITTNSYAVVPFHLGQKRYQSDHDYLLPLSVNLAEQSIMNDGDGNGDVEGNNQQSTTTANDEGSTTKNKKMVLGSIPPLCGSYEPEKFDPKVAGPILKDFLDVYLKEQEANNNNNNNMALSSSPPAVAVDVLLLETIGSIEEAKFYLEEIQNRFSKNHSSRIPIWLSFCLKSEEGMDQIPTLLTSETLTQAITELSSPQENNSSNLLEHVDVIMVNCCDVRIVKDAIVELKEIRSIQNLSVRLGAYPNAFSIPPPDAANHTLRQVDYNITPQVFQNYAREWMEVGASVIGGCCGIGPNHIAALRELKKVEDNNKNKVEHAVK